MIRKTNHKQRFKGGISALLTLAMLMSLLTPVGVLPHSQTNMLIRRTDGCHQTTEQTNWM